LVFETQGEKLNRIARERLEKFEREDIEELFTSARDLSEDEVNKVISMRMSLLCNYACHVITGIATSTGSKKLKELAKTTAINPIDTLDMRNALALEFVRYFIELHEKTQMALSQFFKEHGKSMELVEGAWKGPSTKAMFEKVLGEELVVHDLEQKDEHGVQMVVMHGVSQKNICPTCQREGMK